MARDVIHSVLAVRFAVTKKSMVALTAGRICLRLAW
jgi:hypothetical protein